MHLRTLVYLLSAALLLSKPSRAQIVKKLDTIINRSGYFQKKGSGKLSSARKTTSSANPTTDYLLKGAQKAAFKQNNYPLAKDFLFRAIKRSPKDGELQVFLGRIYRWTGNLDSAKFWFNKVLASSPSNIDAAVAYFDMEYSNSELTVAANVINKAVKLHPYNKALITRQRKVFLAMKANNNQANNKGLPVLNIPAKTNTSIKKANTDTLSVSTPAEAINQTLPKLSDSTTNQPLIKQREIETIQLQLTNQPQVQKSIPATGSKPVQNNSVSLDTSSSDDLLILARKAAFDEKNYEKAKGFLYRALKKTPSYADVQIFLGRIYTWTDNYDSAKFFFESAIKLQPDYEDVSNAYVDLEYFNNKYPMALALVEGGLRYHPNSEDLLIRKAKILVLMKDYKTADLIVKHILAINQKNAEALQLLDKLKVLSAKNNFALSYDFAYFNKQFGNPWHMISAEYGRATDLGKIIGRINFANRFGNNSGQFELDAYPHISKVFYAYLNAGFPLESNAGIFPKFRSGLSLYANLPAAFEAELGIRYLQFTGSPVFIYTASLGKYIKNWLFTERVYMVPSDYSKTISFSIAFTATYYIGGNSSDDAVGGTIGYGGSPDDRSQGILAIERLNSYKIAAFYKKKISKFDVFSLSQGIYTSEYLPGVHGNEFDFSIGITHSF